MYYQSQIRTKSPSINRNEIIKTWTTGKSLPKICDYSFNYLYKNKLISSKQYWDRILKSVDKKNIKLAQYLAKKSQDKRILKAINVLKRHYWKPERYLRTEINGPNLYEKDILLVLIERAMRRNLEKGLNFKKEVIEKFNFNQSQIQKLQIRAAVIASSKRNPEAITLLDSISGDY